MANFTHFNQDGEAIMVDVSQKDITMRIAIAEGSIKVNQEVFRSIKEQTNKKGDVYTLSLHDALPKIGRASCRERV